MDYFRIIRFLPNGKLVMFTSADDIQKSINKIKNLNCAYELPDILSGNYKFEENFLAIIIRKPQFKKNKNKRNPALSTEHGVLSFFINFQIESTRKSNFTKLKWIKYTVRSLILLQKRKEIKISFKYFQSSQLRGQEVLTSEFDLSSSSKFTPFYFSSVKSFHQNSTEILSV